MPETLAVEIISTNVYATSGGNEPDVTDIPVSDDEEDTIDGWEAL